MQTRLILGVVALLTGVVPQAQAQSWPQKPVRVIVPFAPGGNTDGIARIIAQDFSENLGQQFIVENRAGAAGAIASDLVAKAPADGYTLYVTALPVLAVVPFMTKVGYDPIKDFAPISNIGTNPFVLMVNSGLPIKTVGEFVDYIRARPNQVSYGTAGPGSLIHLSTVLLLKRANLDMIPIHYRGGVGPITDTIAGHVPVLFGNMSDVLPQQSNSALRILGISGETRSPQLPNVPTIAESGYPGFKVLTWNGLFAPAGTPKEIIDRLAKETMRALKTPKVAERLASFGVDPVGSTPEEFAATIASDVKEWGAAVEASGVKNQ